MNYNLPSAGCDVLQYKEYQREEHESLHTNAYLKYLAEILNELVSNLDDFEEPDHSSHFDHFVQLSDPRKPCDSIHAACHEH